MLRLRVREVIQEKKITQSKLSRVADVPLNTIQVLYHNPEHDAKLSTLYRLSKALGVKIEDLYEVIPEDRKSTRLNSSHQIISYAVFCLKKKTCTQLKIVLLIDIIPSFTI